MRLHNYLPLILMFALILPARAAEDANDSSKTLQGDFSGNQNLEWEKIQQDLSNVKGKLESQTSLVKSLIESKNQLKGEALDQKLDELKSEFQKLQILTDRYNKINQDYLTKFPERGSREARLYKRIKIKSLQALENEMTIQGRVNRLHSKILSQYPGSVPNAKKVQIRQKSKEVIGSEVSKDPSGTDVTEQIKLNK